MELISSVPLLTLFFLFSECVLVKDKVNSKLASTNNSLNVNASIEHPTEDQPTASLFEELSSFISSENLPLNDSVLTFDQVTDNQNLTDVTRENATKVTILAVALPTHEGHQIEFNETTHAKKENQTIFDGDNSNEEVYTEIVDLEEYRRNHMTIDELVYFTTPDLPFNDNVSLNKIEPIENIEHVDNTSPFTPAEETKPTIMNHGNVNMIGLKNLRPNFIRLQKLIPNGTYDLVGRFGFNRSTANPVDLNLLTDNTIHPNNCEEKETIDGNSSDKHQEKNTSSMPLISVSLILVVLMNTI